MKFLQGILFILLGFALLGIFFLIASTYWDFFSDPGWTTHGNTRSRIEGGNMWYLVLVFAPFAAAAFFSFRQVWILWEDWLSGRIGKIFLGLCLLLLTAVGACIWIAAFENVVESIDGNILGLAGYVWIPGSILFSMFTTSIFLMFNTKIGGIKTILKRIKKNK
jgi:hypothetical protein